MRKPSSISIIFFVILGFIAQNLSRASNEENESEDEVEQFKQWVPLRLHTQETLIKIANIIQEEKFTKIQNTPEDRRDYGYSFPRVNATQRDYLQSIKEMYESSHERPKTIDVGAGHGFMTWKTLLAGGRCDAVEQQNPTYQALMKNVSKAKEFLAEGETVKALCKVKPFDFFAFKEKLSYKEQYDLCWAGNIIHLLTPPQAKEFSAILFNITKPGGEIYVTAHTASTVPSAVELFYENKAKGLEYPGYMLLNKATFRRVDYLTNEEFNTKNEFGEAFPIVTGEEEVPLNFEKNGLYGDEQTSVNWIRVEEDSTGHLVKRYSHSTVHFFDPESLSYIIQATGFDIAEAYYLGNNGERVTSDLSQEDLKQNRYAVAVKAKRPLNK